MLQALRADAGDVLVFLAGAADIRRVGRARWNGRCRPTSTCARSSARSRSPSRTWRWPRRRPDVDGSCSPPTSPRPASPWTACRSWSTADRCAAPATTRGAGSPGCTPGRPRERRPTSEPAGPGARHRVSRYRLWSTGEHAHRRPFAPPEIESVDLAGLALELAVWGTPAERARVPRSPAGARARRRPRPPRRARRARRRPPRHDRRAGDGRASRPPPPRAHDHRGRRPRPRRRRVCAGRAARGARRAARPARGAAHERRRAGAADRRPHGRPPCGRPERRAAGAAAGRRAAAASEDRRPATVRRRPRRLRTGARPRLPRPAGPGPWRRSVPAPHRRGGSRSPSATRSTGEPFLVVADLDAPRTGDDDLRIRMAAGLDEADVEEAAGAAIEEVVTLGVGPRPRRPAAALRAPPRRARPRVQRRAGPGRARRRPPPSSSRCAPPASPCCGGAMRDRALQARIGFARPALGGDWPDVTDDALLDSLDDWLAPRLAGATGRADLERIDLGPHPAGHRRPPPGGRARPPRARPGGRGERADASPSTTRASSRRSRCGSRTCSAPPSTRPWRRGRVPLVVHLLSPAGRPVQVTSDLPGFWAGSWSEVRKDMAGRYPKHDWPLDPATASPSRPRTRRPR